MSTSIDFTYLIFRRLKLNVWREGIEGEERKRKEKRGKEEEEREGGVKE